MSGLAGGARAIDDFACIFWHLHSSRGLAQETGDEISDMDLIGPCTPEAFDGVAAHWKDVTETLCAVMM
ncbi:hypothetical protein [Thalassococcus sp. S3]|uniref:hypothetical protein n=1 Tax=Thalassococcus sp. S3 TaxID=2017482 RepID=UPI0010245CCA|nr:hypothetical protein [Thalassococcus sp. S3]QBF31080.1 hypothetical protein CFI11_07585 [Thalassococcus sp. S3]